MPAGKTEPAGLRPVQACMFGWKVRRAKIALALWIAFLIGLVLLADSGRADPLFALAHSVPLGDKLGHFLLMGTLSFLVNLLQRAEVVRWGPLRLRKGSAIVLSLVTLEECSQLFFRSRSFDLVDLAADVIGIWAFGALARHYLEEKRAKLRKAAPTGAVL